MPSDVNCGEPSMHSVCTRRRPGYTRSPYGCLVPRYSRPTHPLALCPTSATLLQAGGGGAPGAASVAEVCCRSGSAEPWDASCSSVSRSMGV